MAQAPCPTCRTAAGCTSRTTRTLTATSGTLQVQRRGCPTRGQRAANALAARHKTHMPPHVLQATAHCHRLSNCSHAGACRGTAGGCNVSPPPPHLPHALRVQQRGGLARGQQQPPRLRPRGGVRPQPLGRQGGRLDLQQPPVGLGAPSALGDAACTVWVSGCNSSVAAVSQLCATGHKPKGKCSAEGPRDAACRRQVSGQNIRTK